MGRGEKGGGRDWGREREMREDSTLLPSFSMIVLLLSSDMSFPTP
jgi:hypothetical protein